MKNSTPKPSVLKAIAYGVGIFIAAQLVWMVFLVTLSAATNYYPSKQLLLIAEIITLAVCLVMGYGGAAGEIPDELLTEPHPIKHWDLNHPIIAEIGDNFFFLILGAVGGGFMGFVFAFFVLSWFTRSETTFHTMAYASTAGGAVLFDLFILRDTAYKNFSIPRQAINDRREDRKRLLVDTTNSVKFDRQTGATESSKFDPLCEATYPGRKSMPIHGDNHELVERYIRVMHHIQSRAPIDFEYILEYLPKIDIGYDKVKRTHPGAIAISNGLFGYEGEDERYIAKLIAHEAGHNLFGHTGKHANRADLPSEQMELEANLYADYLVEKCYGWG